MSAVRDIQVDVQTAVDPAEVEVRHLPGPAHIRRWVRATLDHEDRGGELTVRVVGEAEGGALNERFRHKAGATNVLSFPAGEPGAALPVPLLGDIVICAPLVVREAGAQGKAVEAHWAHLVVHGVLHLLGYDHQTPDEARVMESRETRLLASLGYADPYAVTAASTIS